MSTSPTKKEIWFVSDTHFSHYNSIKYCNRPFNTTGEMNETLRDNWNSRVKPEDIIYHVGDVTWKGDYGILGELNGEKHLIPGNHDEKVLDKLSRYFNSIQHHRSININGQVVFLSHYPAETWDRSHYGSIHIHGHTHGNLSSYGRLRFDVGVDCNNYFPTNFTDILKQIPKKIKEAVRYRHLLKRFNEVVTTEEEDFDGS